MIKKLCSLLGHAKLDWEGEEKYNSRVLKIVKFKGKCLCCGKVIKEYCKVDYKKRRVYDIKPQQEVTSDMVKDYYRGVR